MAKQYDNREDREDREDVRQDLPATATDPVAPAPDPEKSLGRSMLMKVALASLLIASLIISISNVMRANQLRAQAEEMQAEYDKLKEENRKLQYFLNKEVDENYIIEYARDVLGMFFPDEDVYYNDVND